MYPSLYKCLKTVDKKANQALNIMDGFYNLQLTI